MMIFTWLAIASVFAQDPSQEPKDFADFVGKHVVKTFNAEGVQIYICKAGKWIFVGPNAVLKDPRNNKIVGNHSSCPSCSCVMQIGENESEPPELKCDALKRAPNWILNDGSEFVGKKLSSRTGGSSKSPGIDELVVGEVFNSRRGALADATNVLRLNTKGGLPPNNGLCSSEQEGKSEGVAYKTQYRFIDRTRDGNVPGPSSNSKINDGSSKPSKHPTSETIGTKIEAPATVPAR